MAHYAYLLANPSDDPDAVLTDKDVLVATKNTIPLFWFGLFTPEDACQRVLPPKKGRGGPERVFVPGFKAPTQKAQQTLLSRASHLFNLLPQSLRGPFDQFTQFVASAGTPFVQLDPRELAFAMDRAGLSDLLQKGVRACETDDPEALARAFADRQALRFDPATRKVSVAATETNSLASDLCGVEWSRPVPWRPEDFSPPRRGR
jgi:hypothetical protein